MTVLELRELRARHASRGLSDFHSPDDARDRELIQSALAQLIGMLHEPTTFTTRVDVAPAPRERFGLNVSDVPLT